MALGRKNYLFAGSDKGGERTAAIYTLIQTARLNFVDPEAWARHSSIPSAVAHPDCTKQLVNSVGLIAC